jgi:hypothetical protein
MGYTHYWHMEKPLKIVAVQKKLIDYIISESHDVLDVTINDDKELHLNGIEANSHEDLYFAYGKKLELSSGEKYEFGFCKTARKPYDLAVCKILLVLCISDGFNISSDGAEKNGEGQIILTDGFWNEAIDWFAREGYGHVIENKIYPYLNKPGNC